VTRENRFYVRRECWGGTYVFCVVDRETRRAVTSFVGDRRRAQRQCDRRNDWERFLRASAAETFTGYRGSRRRPLQAQAELLLEIGDPCK